MDSNAARLATLPRVTLILIAIGTTARNYILLFFGAVVGLFFLYRTWSRKESARTKIDDRAGMRSQLAGNQRQAESHRGRSAP